MVELAGASLAPLEILAGAQEMGQVEHEQVRNQFDPLFACFEEAGWRGTTAPDIDKGGGLKTPTYWVEPGPSTEVPEGLPPVLAQCENEHIDFVMRALHLQPSSIDQMNAGWQASKDTIIACLREEGSTIADDAPLDELRYEKVRIEQETGVRCYIPASG